MNITRRQMLILLPAAAVDHSNGLPCETCHQPHNPAIGAGGAK